jgi:hypothetical protein
VIINIFALKFLKAIDRYIFLVDSLAAAAGESRFAMTQDQRRQLQHAVRC